MHSLGAAPLVEGAGVNAVDTDQRILGKPLYRRQEENARLLEYECYAYLEYGRGE